MCNCRLLRWIGCVSHPARPQALKNEHVPCSAGETPAIQQIYLTRRGFKTSEPLSCKLHSKNLIRGCYLKWRPQKSQLLSNYRLLRWIGCVSHPARPQALKNEHVPCSAGETPAIQQLYSTRRGFKSSEPLSCKLHSKNLIKGCYLKWRP